MPIYEYACGACGHTFEEWQKMSDPPVRTCPKCKKKKVEKLISQTAFQLKGGGWYADLYSSSKPGGSKDKDGGSSGGKDGDGSQGGKDGNKDGKDAASTASEKKDAKGDGGSAKQGARPDAKQDGKKPDTKKKDSPKKAESRAV